MKYRHELRDGVHGFVGFDNVEKRLIDSWPFQRLRNMHQLAMCYQVYPGASTQTRTYPTLKRSRRIMREKCLLTRALLKRHSHLRRAA